MSTAARFIVSALAELNSRLAGLAAELRHDPAVRSATARISPRAYDAGDRVECYVDAELASGHAIGCWLEFREDGGSWIVESSIRFNGDEGEDELVGLPERYAVGDVELVAELRGAVSALIEAVRRLDLSAR